MHRIDGLAWYFARDNKYEWHVNGVLQTRTQVLRRIKRYNLPSLPENANIVFAPERPKLKKLKMWYPNSPAEVIPFYSKKD